MNKQELEAMLEMYSKKYKDGQVASFHNDPFKDGLFLGYTLGLAAQSPEVKKKKDKK